MASLHGRVFLLALLAVSVAYADVRDSTSSGFTLENSATVPVDAATAWRALIEDIDRWWPRDHTWWGAESALAVSPRAGGCFCESAGDRQAVHLQVVFVDPRRTLRLLGGLGPLQGMGVHGVMEWRLQPADGGTMITWHYRAGGYTAEDLSELAPIVDRVQAQQLGGLVEYLRR